MSGKDDFFKQVFESYFQKVLSEVLPVAVKDAICSLSILKKQDFIPLRKAVKRYDLCRKTLYNYPYKGYITLHSSEGKTFVSVMELENHIRNNLLPRKV